MFHRHIIETARLSLAAIDDIIDRGGVVDWRELKAQVDADSSLAEKILKICAVKIGDPFGGFDIESASAGTRVLRRI